MGRIRRTGSKTTTTNVLYDNCRALSPEGLHMFYCTKKLARSYIKKGLAEVLCEEPLVFRLKFIPKGPGSPALPPRPNRCECCKTEDNLTRHHVVPYEYRKWFPLELKSHRSHDYVVPLCRKCHDEYEAHAFRTLRWVLDFCIADHIHKLKQKESALRAVKTLVRSGEFLPQTTAALLRQRITECTWINDELQPRAQKTVEEFGTAKLTEMWMLNYERWLAAARTKKRRRNNGHTNKKTGNRRPN